MMMPEIDSASDVGIDTIQSHPNNISSELRVKIGAVGSELSCQEKVIECFKGLVWSQPSIEWC